MNDEMIQNKIREWLESETGADALALVAKSILKTVKNSRIPIETLNFPDPATAAPGEVIDAIQSELAIMILENRAGICKRIMAPEVNRGQMLIRVFIKQILDRVRSSPTLDPFRYLYKRSADALRDSADFYLRLRKTGNKWMQGTLYSLKADSVLIGPLADDVVAGIAFPAETHAAIDFDTGVKKKNIRRLAKFFWRQVSQLFEKQAIWIELRDLTYWIYRSIPPNGIQQPTELTTKTSDEAVKNPLGSSPDGHPGNRAYPADFDTEQIREWATLFANRLNEKEQLVLCLRYGGSTLKETAAQMGLKTPSGVSNHLDHIAEKLATFTSDLPWLSPDGPIEADPQARDFFITALVGMLKNRHPVP